MKLKIQSVKRSKDRVRIEVSEVLTLTFLDEASADAFANKATTGNAEAKKAVASMLQHLSRPVGKSIPIKL
jgi:hypothetical protein